MLYEVLTEVLWNNMVQLVKSSEESDQKILLYGSCARFKALKFVKTSASRLAATRWVIISATNNSYSGVEVSLFNLLRPIHTHVVAVEGERSLLEN